MISNWSEEAQEIIIKAKLEMSELKHPYVGTEHLVLAILHTKSELTERLNKYIPDNVKRRGDIEDFVIKCVEDYVKRQRNKEMSR